MKCVPMRGAVPFRTDRIEFVELLDHASSTYDHLETLEETSHAYP
jgi:hypothetical protein